VVHRFTAAARVEVETYRVQQVNRNEYFQGHYLKSVSGVQKATETLEVAAGSYYVSTAQSRGNLIAYMMEPETDDNLITWGWADHLLRVNDAPAAGGGRGGRGGGAGAAAVDPDEPPTAAQAGGQRVPMMRVVKEHQLPLLEVVPFNEFSRNRYYRIR
jgi:hypothetical protein